MSLTSQQYAGLADDSYIDMYPARVFPPGKEPPFEYEGVQFKVLEHYRSKVTGYQGTIYQHVNTDEIIVAHRGTEGDKKWEGWVKDGAIVDAAMVTSRVNLQASDATALTQRALDRARDIGSEAGYSPVVTVTGHSLGGTLAQLTAHYFDLKGETFNAYGAASLGYRLPEGGNSVINHVMAADSVSAASTHYGQVRKYATPDEIAKLHVAGYANDRNALDPRMPLAAAAATLGSHSMHHFLNVDGEKQPDRSILSDPAARQLAQAFEPMIDKFRGDVELGRALVTATARDPLGRVQDGIAHLRGPAPAGEPAQRDEQMVQQRIESARRAAELDERVRSFSKPHPLSMSADGGQVPASIQSADTTRPTETPPMYSLPDFSPPLQTSPRTRGHGHHSDPMEERHQDDGRQRNDQVQNFPTYHPSHPLYAALAQQLPGLSNEKTAEITLAAHRGGITSPHQVAQVIIHNDQVWVAARTPGDRANVSLSAPAPPISETLRKMDAFHQQQAQQSLQFRQQQDYVNRTAGAPCMSIG